MKLNVYGRHLEILRENAGWTIYILGEGKKRKTHDITIPSHLTESEVVTFLADLLHEAASAENPTVERLS